MGTDAEHIGPGVQPLDWQKADYYIRGISSPFWIIHKLLETFVVWQEITTNFHFRVGEKNLSVVQLSVVAIS